MSAVEGSVIKRDAVQEKGDKIDFKMVTFSLAGKDYGIDIMKVKDIAKDSDFTYVPNTAPYVRGVYNLRGEIISIIDLRIMFNLPVEKKSDDEVENIIILRLEDYILGVIVDSTDKIVGVSSESIQPTHPLFGDINVQYISGVVEHDNRLYIILDVEKIFGQTAGEQQGYVEPPCSSKEGPSVQNDAPSAVHEDEQELTFITETLSTFMHFFVSEINSDWVKTRFAEWKTIRGKDAADLQLKTPEEAEEFLSPFYSQNSGELLGEDYYNALKAFLSPDSVIRVWNPGCGKGLESYSLACFMKALFPDKQVKVWASDNDLLRISSAPSLVFGNEFVPPVLQPFLVEVQNGYQFKPEIKDAILFEYHDILHENPYSNVDVVFTRDVLSFLRVEDQQKMIIDVKENLKKGGLLFLGKHEKMPGIGWERLEEGHIVAFRKETE